MREIVLDTETTGFDPQSGDRIVEIGAIELMGHVPTSNVFHEYIDPEREMPKEAFEVHGLGDEFLRGKPKFAQIGQRFLDFIGDAKLVIHNAEFDMKFINHHLKEMGVPVIPNKQVIDTLIMARQKFPGSPASLDALCKRFQIDNSNRTLHGALLDSELLAEVYLELLGGRQVGLSLDNNNDGSTANKVESLAKKSKKPIREPRIFEIPTDELNAHHQMIETLGDKALWKKRN